MGGSFNTIKTVIEYVGLINCIVHNILCWQFVPVKPLEHLHRKPSSWSMQVPPLKHGLSAQAFPSVKELEKKIVL